MEGLRLWKTAFSNDSKSKTWVTLAMAKQLSIKDQVITSLASDKKIVIMPCKCAPSRQLVQAWLQAKEEYERSKKLSKMEPTGVVKSAEDFSSSVNPR